MAAIADSNLKERLEKLERALTGTLPWLEYLRANHANLAGLNQDIENIKALV